MTNTATSYIVAVLKVEQPLDSNLVLVPDLLAGLNARLGEFYATRAGDVDEVIVPTVVTLAGASPEAYRLLAGAIEVGSDADADLLAAMADTDDGVTAATLLCRRLVNDARAEDHR